MDTSQCHGQLRQQVVCLSFKPLDPDTQLEAGALRARHTETVSLPFMKKYQGTFAESSTIPYICRDINVDCC
jgi:hypothetical protein